MREQYLSRRGMLRRFVGGSVGLLGASWVGEAAAGPWLRSLSPAVSRDRSKTVGLLPESEPIYLVSQRVAVRRQRRLQAVESFRILRNRLREKGYVEQVTLAANGREGTVAEGAQLLGIQFSKAQGKPAMLIAKWHRGKPPTFFTSESRAVSKGVETTVAYFEDGRLTTDKKVTSHQELKAQRSKANLAQNSFFPVLPGHAHGGSSTDNNEAVAANDDPPAVEPCCEIYIESFRECGDIILGLKCYCIDYYCRTYETVCGGGGLTCDIVCGLICAGICGPNLPCGIVCGIACGQTCCETCCCSDLEYRSSDCPYGDVEANRAFAAAQSFIKKNGPQRLSEFPSDLQEVLIPIFESQGIISRN